MYILGYSTKSFGTDDVLKKPLFIITNVNPDADELNGYVAEGGLSALATDPNGKATYESLRVKGATALLIHPSFVSTSVLESAAPTPAASPLRLPNIATLVSLVTSAVIIPWLLTGSSKKNFTNSTTFKREGHILELCQLELSVNSVHILEGLNHLPASIVKNK
jgi:hypothetical protein